MPHPISRPSENQIFRRPFYISAAYQSFKHFQTDISNESIILF
ncbi:hypothetical protein NEISUBOT_04384 [Neisseria subflava NJ9703]|uniref:Uncharacterized protein n=1 Tax=Neisseria subflava NJ9703 TaxID=546268 RepID=A0A9W5MZD4_NEISU|nr:hypothetical protein NEISUBOT_04384 [Neisseria subflava NJ9703]